MNKMLCQRGSVLIYILIAIALIAALTASFMQPASQQTRSQNTFKVSAELSGQINMIRAAMQDCILQYPEGDNQINEIGYHGIYPLNPDSEYLPTDDGIRAANREVANLRCPGNNPGGVNRAKHRLLFGAASGRFLPEVPAMFDPWVYYNGNNTVVEGVTLNGVYFETGSTASDAYVRAAMQKLTEQYNSCEVQYIDGNGGNGCASGRACLRVWIKRLEPSCE